jgi:hypothetical protein
MSLTATVQPWMRSAGPRAEAALTARTHVAAETTGDTEQICGTVSHDVFFGVPVRTRAGNELVDGTVLVDYDQVRGYYTDRSGSYVVTASAQLKSVATDWFLFNESAASLRGTGSIGGVDADGAEFVVNSAVLFPTAPDGIRGEICVTRWPFADIVAGTVAVPPPPAPGEYLPRREIEHCQLLDRLTAALPGGDRAELGALLHTNQTLAVRHDDRGGHPRIHSARDHHAAVDALVALFSDVDDLTLLTRIATEWYVFAEYLGRTADGGLRRLAAVHPVDDGLIGGTFGYGFDEPE